MDKPFQIATILMMFALTFLLFRSLGPQRSTLLYTRAEKKEWDDLIGSRLGDWITVTNIAGTLTSLATAYLFFLGNSKLFGAWIFLCCFTIFAGAFVTNWFTDRICSRPDVGLIFDAADQNTAVIASIFWRSGDPAAQRTSRIVKVISLLNIAAVIWLEFALFADIGGGLLGLETLPSRVALLLVGCFAVFYFTLKLGLRGFVFADLFHTPMLLVGVSSLIVGCSIALYLSGTDVPPLGQLLAPELSLSDCILFALHVIALNLVLVLVTESHWLRVWMFRNRETSQQGNGVFLTAVIWGMLIVVGFGAHLISNKLGNDAILSTLSELSTISVVFVCAFWIGGIAALFSTADVQIYSFLLVTEFDTGTGQLRGELLNDCRPVLSSIAAALVFGLAYSLIRHFEIPFEKVIFVIIPLSLNLFPAFVLSAFRKRQSPAYLVVSVLLYFICSVLGFALPENQFVMTLMAAIMPVVVAGFALLLGENEVPLDD